MEKLELDFSKLSNDELIVLAEQTNMPTIPEDAIIRRYSRELYGKEDVQFFMSIGLTLLPELTKRFKNLVNVAKTYGSCPNSWHDGKHIGLGICSDCGEPF